MTTRTTLAPSAQQLESIDVPLRGRVRRPHADVSIIEASGALDAATEPLFAEPVRHRLLGPGTVTVLDLSAVTFLDTTGAVTMLEAADRSRVHGTQLVVVSSPAVDRLLDLLDVTDRFTYLTTVEQALTGSVRTGSSPPGGHDEHAPGQDPDDGPTSPTAEHAA